MSKAPRTTLLLLLAEMPAPDGIVCVTFTDPAEALQAALSLQREAQSLGGAARMALHAGAPGRHDADHDEAWMETLRLRAGRVLQAAHPGQIILTRAAGEALRPALSPELDLLDLGEHRLRDLERPERLYLAAPRGLTDRYPAPRTLRTFPNSLPTFGTGFVGRAEELTQVARRLGETRLLTLVGAGGCGKTRLAAQAAADSIESFRDGVWFVDAGLLWEPTRLAPTVAAALGLREEAGRSAESLLAEFLPGRSLLLLLDNCEHILSACISLVEHLLRASADVRILATSRESLHAAGEMVWKVPSLAVPSSDRLQTLEQFRREDAVRLFEARARRANPAFRLDYRAAPFVAQVCRRLDGIPLAIELAAAQSLTLTPREIARKLGDRFRLLTGGSRGPMQRQQTLVAAFDWSCDLLAPHERALLRRLSVFRGTWSIEAAEAVCADLPRRGPRTAAFVDAREVEVVVEGLVRKSLVVREERAAGEAPRFRLLESMRVYSRAKLVEAGEAEETMDRHRQWCIALAEAASARIPGPEEAEWLRRLDDELENLRAALGWCQSRRTRLKLCAPLGMYWYIRGRLNEGRGWVENGLNLPGRVNDKLLAQSLTSAGILAWAEGDLIAARIHHARALELRRKSGDAAGMAVNLNALGMVEGAQGNQDRARELFLEVLQIAYENDLTRHIGSALNNLGSLATEAGDHAAALRYLEQGLELHRRMGNERLAARAQFNLGYALLKQGRVDEATPCLRESLLDVQRLGDRTTVPHVVSAFAEAALRRDEPQRAARLLGAEERLREEAQTSMKPFEQREREELLAALRFRMGEETLWAALEAGTRMTEDEAVACCLEAGNYAQIR